MGLLDILNTPAGVGLLSAVAGGLAGARRGTPINNVGRGALAGLTGYSQANDQLRQDKEKQLADQYRQMQIDQMRQTMDDAKQKREFMSGLPGAIAGRTPEAWNVGEQAFQSKTTAEAAAAPQTVYQPRPQTPDMMPEMNGRAAPLMTFQDYAPEPVAVNRPQQQVQHKPDSLQQYLMRPGSQYAEKQLERLMLQPKWTLGERFNEKTGMKEKVFYDENQTTQEVRPFGGSEADSIVSDNLGGSIVLRGAHSATPLGQLQRTATPDAIMTDSRTRHEGAANRAQSERTSLRADSRARDLNEINRATKTANLSEGERKAATLLNRLTFSQQQLKDALVDKPTAATPGLTASGLRSVGMDAAANTFATSSERQRVESAQLDMLDAALTLGTGAAYTREQLEGYRKSYFPQIGDSDAQIKDKSARLQNIVESAKIAAGRAAPTTPALPNTDALPGGWKVKEY